MQPTSRSTRWSQDRRAEGRCVSCGKPAERSLCSDHLRSQRLRMRDRRQTGKDLVALIIRRVA